MKRLMTLAVVSIALVLPRVAWADNTTSVGAYSLMIGGTPSETQVNSTGPVDRWYLVFVVAGRSYCAETQGGVFFDTSAAAGNIDSTLTVYRNDATTVVVSNDDAFTEPAGYFASRACFIATLTDTTYVKVTSLGGAFNIRVRMVETSLFSNWFFLGGDYAAYTLLRNSTNTAVLYTVNWRNGSGAIVATTTGTLAGNGSTFINAGSFPAAVAALSGTVEVVHNAAPQAIVASTTVLSGATGLSFDAPFVARTPW